MIIAIAAATFVVVAATDVIVAVAVSAAVVVAVTVVVFAVDVEARLFAKHPIVKLQLLSQSRRISLVY